MGEPGLDALAGGLRVIPGAPLGHNLASERPQWVDRLTRGQSAQALPGLLASLFNLCGHAHRLCAGMAVAAARGTDGAGAGSRQHAGRLAQAAQALRTETLREHLRRIHLDWPLQLGAGQDGGAGFQAGALPALRRCPLPLVGELSVSHDMQPALARWLERDLLGLPADQWLSGWEGSPHGWLGDWSARGTVWLAALLRQCQPVADPVLLGVATLRVHGHDAALRGLAEALRTQPGFSRQPLWEGQCAETGPWNRLQPVSMGGEAPMAPAQAAPRSTWVRLGARLAEAVRLALPDQPGRSGASWLSMGALATGEHEGLAWVEMARGLLIHHVQLDGAATDARVLACHVVAPTEWNFHPQGAVAQWLATLPQDLTSMARRRILAVMAAYDPCVKFTVCPAPAPQGVPHA